jgi:cbb3-type cytochrome oxidase cytochrome c subunit
LESIKKKDLAGRKFLTLSIWEKMIWHGLPLHHLHPPRSIIPISFMTSRAYIIETIRIENIPKHWPMKRFGT